MQYKLDWHLLDSLHEGICFVDLKGNLVFWNEAAARFTGRTRHELLNTPYNEELMSYVTIEGNGLAFDQYPLQLTLLDGQERMAHYFLRHRDGYRLPTQIRTTPLRDESNNLVGAAEVFICRGNRPGIIQDLESTRKDIYIDMLTDVGNRRFAETILQSLLFEQDGSSLSFCALFVAIDNFERIIELHGNEIGDSLIRQTAYTISNIVRAPDNVAHWGREEFIIILPITSTEIMLTVAQRIRRFIERSWIEVDGQLIKITGSIGASQSYRSDTPHMILERIQTELKRAQKRGGNRVVVFEKPQ